MSSQRRSAPNPRLLLRRLLLHLAFSLALLAASLAVGMWGYSHYEHLPWRDAFVNAAMLLGGMGPVKLDLSESGKVFAGLFALYSGLVVIAVTALLLAPGIHHMMKRVHWEDRTDPK
ncbi:MAG: hypothetical protein KGS09_14380 [Nitrospirae bacterium]|nr:hypothetical protein [Nitrospirota bacterium]MDE3051015.1 hypothetical protein [Nitrospirota bacterium]MDE3219019.1 hypothetical protein [Nitrospirota bacterium]